MYGVGIDALDDAAYIANPLEWGIKGKRGVIVHEYMHFIDSLFEAIGDLPEKRFDPRLRSVAWSQRLDSLP